MRSVVGNDIPVVASLDLHANVTRRMVEHTDALLIAYRTYPHVDMAETGARAAHFLLQRPGGAAAPASRALRRLLDFLIPLHAAVHHARAHAIDLRRAGRDGRRRDSDALVHTRLSGGRLSRVRSGGIAYGQAAEAAAQAERAAIVRVVQAPRRSSTSRCIRRKKRCAARHRGCRPGQRPVVIADTQDNPGAGGNSDTTGMLRALVGANAQRARARTDGRPRRPRARRMRPVRAARSRSRSAASRASPATRLPGPLRRRAARPTASFTCTGPFYRGARMNAGAVGLSAHRRRARRGGVARSRRWPIRRCIASSASSPARAGDPGVNKSSVHFRADFAPIARRDPAVQGAGADARGYQRLPVEESGAWDSVEAMRAGVCSRMTENPPYPPFAKGGTFRDERCSQLIPPVAKGAGGDLDKGWHGDLQSTASLLCFSASRSLRKTIRTTCKIRRRRS